MEYLSKQIHKSPIVCCEATFICRDDVAKVNAIPSEQRVKNACKRFNILRVYGGELLTRTILHLELSEKAVLAHLSFKYDSDRKERLGSKPRLPYLHEEIAELPGLTFGDPNSPPVVLEELIDLSKVLALPENKHHRETLSVMLHEAALIMVMTNCQGSA